MHKNRSSIRLRLYVKGVNRKYKSSVFILRSFSHLYERSEKTACLHDDAKFYGILWISAGANTGTLAATARERGM